MVGEHGQNGGAAITKKKIEFATSFFQTWTNMGTTFQLDAFRPFQISVAFLIDNAFAI